MAVQQLHQLLDERDIHYEVTRHPEAFTAQEVAAAEHITGWDVAKPVLLRVGQDIVMVVVPAPMEVDLERARDAFGGERVRLATEDEFRPLFPDTELGAEPPFGNGCLYDIPVYLDQSMRDRDRMICRDGSHTETVTLASSDYVEMVEPATVAVAVPQDR